MTFRNWRRFLPEGIEVCPVEYPGRGARFGELPYNTMDALVESTTRALLKYFYEPFAIFGHSLGGLIGFEVARYLRNHHGRRPVHLFVSAVGAPQIPEPNRKITQLPDADFLKALKRYNGIPEQVFESAELVEFLLPMARADLTAYETYLYSHEPPLDFPISAFGGLQDPWVLRNRLEGWREQTRARFSLRMLPGEHLFLHSAEGLLLELLRRDLCGTD